ncbi:hypothetical protein BD410DRAFT_623525 [Rickenella mellea]|uniref:Uncharacterized protein n=1 Tax=Rickenella mellea TaxID=50990 RepID=A0A4Y7PP75_9AGAM|nr:hypothetical protein BD410DRAFT_623525 [Rickenella mellea]
MSESMSDIHQAIVQYLDDFSVENPYFRSFNAIVRQQLDPVWHKVGPKSKQLVSPNIRLTRIPRVSRNDCSLKFYLCVGCSETEPITVTLYGRSKYDVSNRQTQMLSNNVSFTRK